MEKSLAAVCWYLYFNYHLHTRWILCECLCHTFSKHSKLSKPLKWFSSFLLCFPGYSGTCYLNKIGLEQTGISLPLSPKCIWINGICHNIWQFYISYATSYSLTSTHFPEGEKRPLAPVRLLVFPRAYRPYQSKARHILLLNTFLSSTSPVTSPLHVPIESFLDIALTMSYQESSSWAADSYRSHSLKFVLRTY